MFAKTNFSTALTTQGFQRRSEGSSGDLFRRGIFTAIMNLGQVLLTWLAVSSGLPGEPEDLETMGVHLGPNHV